MGTNKESKRTVTNSAWTLHSLRAGNTNQIHIPTLHLPICNLSCLLPLVQVSSVTVCWVPSPSTQTICSSSNCSGWAVSGGRTVCAEAQKQLAKSELTCIPRSYPVLVSSSLLLGLAPAYGGWIFTLCLWAVPREVSVWVVLLPFFAPCSDEIAKGVFSLLLMNVTLFRPVLPTLWAGHIQASSGLEASYQC